MIAVYMADGNQLEFPNGKGVRSGRSEDEPFSVVVLGESDKELARFRPEQVKGYVLDGVAVRQQHGHTH
jgi:hypothetical protein